MWTIKRQADGTDECRHDDRLMAVIEKRDRAARPWTVKRVRKTRNGALEVALGGDSFKSLAAAREFVLNNPAVWGR